MNIFKYTLSATPSVQPVSMPGNAKILSTANQNSNLVIWAFIPTKPTKDKNRIIIVEYTGATYAVTTKSQFIGTVQIGGLVYHVFEGK